MGLSSAIHASCTSPKSSQTSPPRHRHLRGADILPVAFHGRLLFDPPNLARGGDLGGVLAVPLLDLAIVSAIGGLAVETCIASGTGTDDDARRVAKLVGGAFAVGARIGDDIAMVVVALLAQRRTRTGISRAREDALRELAQCRAAAQPASIAWRAMLRLAFEIATRHVECRLAGH